MVVIGSLVGFLFACLGIALGRMGAHHLYALPAHAAPPAGLDALLPWVADLQQPGVALLAVGWLVATFLGSYVADLVARSVAAGWVVTLAVCLLALLLGMVGRVPPSIAAAGIALALAAGLHARIKACSARLGQPRKAGHRPQPQRRAERQVRPLAGTPQWQQFLSASACADAALR